MVEKKAQKKDEKKKAVHEHKKPEAKKPEAKKPEAKEKLSPSKAAAKFDDDYDECDEIRYLECKKCGLLVSVEEECGCDDCNIMCCGEPMLELVPSMEGEVFSCPKCGIKVIVEEDCACDTRCDLVCCNKPMILLED
jgi:hypothetical protein